VAPLIAAVILVPSWGSIGVVPLPILTIVSAPTSILVAILRFALVSRSPHFSPLGRRGEVRGIRVLHRLRAVIDARHGNGVGLDSRDRRGSDLPRLARLKLLLISR
jgi:hypothetical protein